MIDPRHLVPRPRHARLVEAALHADRGVAQRALAEWSRDLDLDDLDTTEQRLLGLLADRLDELGADPALVARVGVIVRFSWLRTHALLAAVRPVLADLAGGDVPFLLIKGGALVAGESAGLGRRPFDDIDLLVPPSGIPVVVGTLRARGFDSRIAEGLIARPRQFLGPTHSTAFAKGQAEVDLHWRATPLARRPEVEEGRWQDARLVDVAGVPVGIPDPTESLLLALEHEAVPTPSGSARWIADAAVLIDGGGVDPVRLRRRARDLDLTSVLDQAARTFTALTDRPFPVAPRPHGRLVAAVRAARPADPRVDAVAGEWQRRRALAPAGVGGNLSAARRTWAAIGGRAFLASPSVLGAVDPLGAGGAAEQANPWAWACRRVDLSFGLNDEGQGWLRTGWSSPEPGFTWTDGVRANLEVPADVAPGEPLVLDVVAHGMVTPSAGPYRVVWSVDGRPIHVQPVDDSDQHWLTLSVPAGVARGGTVHLDLDVRWPRTAIEAGTGTDLRRLGLGISWLRLMSAWSPRPSDGPEAGEATP